MPTSKQLKVRMTKMQKDIEKLKAKIAKDTALLFKVSFAELFKKHKRLKSFAWTQYTPHWNDGDTCTFGANKEYLYLNDSEEEEALYNVEELYKALLDKDNVIKKLEAENKKFANKEDKKWEVQSNERKIKELKETDIDDVEWKVEALRDIMEIMESVDDDTLLEMFDDHVKVVVTKDGIETESYSHD